MDDREKYGFFAAPIISAIILTKLSFTYSHSTYHPHQSFDPNYHSHQSYLSVAQLDYHLCFNIQRTEKYSITMCYNHTHYPLTSAQWVVPYTDISGMPRLDRNFRNKQHQCTTQTQMFHDSKVLECLIRILCEKKEYSNLLFWRYCGTRDLGCATWNTFVPIA